MHQLYFLLFLSTTLSFITVSYAQPVGDSNSSALLSPVDDSLSRNSSFPAIEPFSQNSSTYLPLAAERTRRKDPLNGFNRYTGGWNLKDRHYWASVGSTAALLFIVSAIWFLGFGLCLFVFFVIRFFGGATSFGYSRIVYLSSLVLIVVLAALALVGCVILYTGQGRFHHGTKETLNYILDQKDTTVIKLREVSVYLASAKVSGVDEVFVPSNIQTDIDEIGSKISGAASSVDTQTKSNASGIRELIDSLRVALFVVSAVMLVLISLGLLFSFFGMQLLVYILVILGWLVVSGTFILCGTFLILHNVSADTCVAMNEWVQNPTSKSPMDDILPCVDNSTTQETLQKSKEVSYQLVEVVNQVITNISNINFSPNFKSVYINQSGPLVPVLCNPFHGDLSERNCSPGEVDLNNATQVWMNFVCQVSEGVCSTSGRLTPNFYTQMAAAVNVSATLRDYSPFLIQLEDCTFVREALAQVYVEKCPRIRRDSFAVVAGLVVLTVAVMLSNVLWIVYEREKRYLFTKY